jgi:hypothetical protein
LRAASKASGHDPSVAAHASGRDGGHTPLDDAHATRKDTPGGQVGPSTQWNRADSGHELTSRAQGVDRDAGQVCPPRSSGHRTG